jgi:hypothetical protein
VLCANALAQAGHITQVNQLLQNKRVAIVFSKDFAVVLKLAVPVAVDLLYCAVCEFQCDCASCSHCVLLVCVSVYYTMN